MNAQVLFADYLLPIAIGLMVLWVAYRLLFTNSNRFQFNRAFLLGALLFSLALPLIRDHHLVRRTYRYYLA